MRINKLKELDNTESFIQVNFTKGYKYIDKAGEIINMYVDAKVKYNMDQNRLILLGPSDTISELRISVRDFWCHFTNTGNFTATNTKITLADYMTHAKKVMAVTRPDKLKRVGWRSYFIYELGSGAEGLGRVSKVTFGKTTEQVTVAEVGDLKVKIRVALVEEKQNTDKKALLFDVDISKDGDFALDDLRPQLEQIRLAFFTNDLLDFINSILERH